MALQVLFGILGDIIWYFHIFVYKIYLFAITAYFLSFPDKNLWFSSQRRREGVVGDVNGSISKIMYCTCFLCSSQKYSIAIHINSKINWH